jgi:hypothetical protein
MEPPVLLPAYGIFAPCLGNKFSLPMPQLLPLMLAIVTINANRSSSARFARKEFLLLILFRIFQ